jgi:class I fructose-bisphosphate aldolase
MRISSKVKKLLSFYESDNPGTKVNLARLLTHGRLGNTGKIIILPVDQGFEHGPVRSFAMNAAALDPHYHYQMAVDAGLSGYAAPLGLLEAGADTFAGAIPTILKMNSGNILTRSGQTSILADQAITASVKDALRLGCVGIGLTIYPGSDQTYAMFEEVRELAEEAKSYGLVVIIWSYPRGNVSKEGETAIDVVAYAAHMAALLGAHIIKVKLPTAHIESADAKTAIEKNSIDVSSLQARVRYMVQTCFNGRRMIIFSGGVTKEPTDVYEDTRAILAGGGHGCIIGRNCFQRPRQEALIMLDQIIRILQGKAHI